MRQTSFNLILFFLSGFFLIVGNIALAQSQVSEADSISFVKDGDEIRSQFNPMQISLDSNVLILQKAMSLFAKAGNLEKKAMCYNDLAVAYYLAGSLSEAEKNNQTALEIIKNERLDKNSTYADAIFNLVTIKDVKGFDLEAVKLYQEMIELDKKLNTPLNIMVYSYQNMGTAYIDIGDYEEAIQALNNALRIRNSLPSESKEAATLNQAEIGGIYSDLGRCYKQKGEFKTAIEFLEKSLKALPGDKGDLAYTDRVRYNCYYKLAEIYLETGQKKLAGDFATKAIEIKNRSEDYVFGRSYSYQVLAKLKLVEGENTAAILYFDQAIEAARKESEGFQNFPQIATAYIEKGNALIQLSKYEEALSVFQKGLKVISIDFEETDIYENPKLENIIQKLSALDLITGKARAFSLRQEIEEKKAANLKQAYEHYDLAAQLIQLIRRDFNTTASKHILAERANRIYEESIEICHTLFNETKNPEYLEQAFLFAESNKAIVLLESMNESLALNHSGLPDSILDLERTISIDLSYSERKLAELKAAKQNVSTVQINKLEKERISLKEDYRVLIKKIEEEYPRYYDLKYASITVSLEKIQRELLDEHTALLEYFVGEKVIYSFLITKGGLNIEIREKTPEFFDSIAFLRQSLGKAPESDTFIAGYQSFTQCARVLYRLLLEKQIAEIPNKIKNILIIPDDIIGYIPFDVLLMKDANRNNADYNPANLAYLMERFFISYSYSGNLLFNKKTSSDTKERSGFIGFAPSFNDHHGVAERTCTESELYSLKCSSKEVNTINAGFGGYVIEGINATKKSFLEEVPNYKIVHLATHACINETNPMLHRVHFANDFITPYDLYNLKLNSELVVLSACNTGSGQVVKGEGVMSLSRGFIQAGAASTLMSLWSVDDCATSDMMTSFYKYLQSGDTKNVALQNARLEYINTVTDKAKGHPYYWAAFVQFGDTSAILQEKGGSLLIYIFSFAGLMVVVFFLFKNRGF